MGTIDEPVSVIAGFGDFCVDFNEFPYTDGISETMQLRIACSSARLTVGDCSSLQRFRGVTAAHILAMDVVNRRDIVPLHITRANPVVHLEYNIRPTVLEDAISLPRFVTAHQGALYQNFLTTISAYFERTTTIVTGGERYWRDVHQIVWPRRIVKLVLSADIVDSNLSLLQFPDSLQELDLASQSSVVQGLIVLPPSLKVLRVYKMRHISLNSLQGLVALEILDVQYDFNSCLGHLPASLREISIGNLFNQPLVGVQLPPSLIKLKLGSNFNQPLVGVNFPPTLVDLDCGHTFQQPLVGVTFPPNLRRLDIGDWYNHALDGVVFPPTLRELSIGRDFTQTLLGVVFPNLTTLVSRSGFNGHDMRWVNLPNTLTTLRFVECDPGFQNLRLPPSLTHLRVEGTTPMTGIWFPGSFFNLPTSGVRYLHINNFPWGVSLPLNQWPTGLRELECRYSVPGPLTAGVIPATLEKLTIGGGAGVPSQLLVGVNFPITLTEINLMSEDITLAGVVLPAALQKLTAETRSLLGAALPNTIRELTTSHTGPLAQITFPTSLRVLTLLRFNAPLVGLPASLEILRLGSRFNHAVSGLSHANIEKLIFSSHGNFNHPLENLVLPRLVVLEVPDHSFSDSVANEFKSIIDKKARWSSRPYW